MTPTLPPINLDAVNPGVRRLVALLRANGFDTADSGDGQTREFECDPGYPYVHMVVRDPYQMITEADRLMVLLHGWGVEVEGLDEDGSCQNIDASYDPKRTDAKAVIALINVVDADLVNAPGADD